MSSYRDAEWSGDIYSLRGLHGTHSSPTAQYHEDAHILLRCLLFTFLIRKPDEQQINDTDHPLVFLAHWPEDSLAKLQIWPRLSYTPT